MGIYDLMRRNVAMHNFDFTHFIETSLHAYKCTQNNTVNMEIFDLDNLRDNIIWNLYHQGLTLKTDTSLMLIKLLAGDFSSITETILLQVLLHYARMDITEMYKSYSTDFDKSGIMSDEKISEDDYFDNLIVDFVRAALAERKTACEVMEISGEMKDIVCKALLTDSVLLALQVCLKDILTTHSHISLDDIISLDWLKNQISEMKIYVVENFSPLMRLRGACLVDGVLLCTNKLARGTEVNKADMVTIAIHTCCHYLARLKCENFNLSATFSFLPSQHGNRPVLLVRNELELGKSIELLLFDGIQPHWSLSSDKAAKRFLDLLWTSQTYPILPKSLRKNLGLTARIPTSSSFGIDVQEYHLFC